ncbi:MAG: hypothetical protein ABI766_04035 [Gemmatimonadales bacterium]
MTTLSRIYINGAPVDVEPGTDVRGALRSHDEALAAAYEAGRARVTDARGIEVAGEQQLSAGSILRVVTRSSRGEGGSDADA